MHHSIKHCYKKPNAQQEEIDSNSEPKKAQVRARIWTQPDQTECHPSTTCATTPNSLQLSLFELRCGYPLQSSLSFRMLTEPFVLIMVSFPRSTLFLCSSSGLTSGLTLKSGLSVAPFVAPSSPTGASSSTTASARRPRKRWSWSARTAARDLRW